MHRGQGLLAHYQPLRGVVAGFAAFLTLTIACRAADRSAESNPVQSKGHEWTGAYVGAELGYAAGSSDWSAAGVRRQLSQTA